MEKKSNAITPVIAKLGKMKYKGRKNQPYKLKISKPKASSRSSSKCSVKKN